MVSSLNGAAVQNQTTLSNPLQRTQESLEQQNRAETEQRDNVNTTELQRTQDTAATQAQETTTENDQEQDQLVAQAARDQAQASGRDGDEQRGTRLDITV